MIQDRAIVTMKGEYETTPKLLNGTSFNDLEWPLTQISRSRYYSTSNNSKTVPDRAIFTLESRIWSIERRHFQWPRTTLNPVFKVTLYFEIAEYLING